MRRQTPNTRALAFSPDTRVPPWFASWIFFLPLFVFSCATARVVGPPVVIPPESSQVKSVVLEPFFETAEWKTEVSRTQSDWSNMGQRGWSAMGRPMVIRETVTTRKPVLAEVDALSEEYRLVLAHLKRLRPTWQIVTTSGVATVEGPVTVVRVVIDTHQTIGTNRPLKNAAFSFGLLIWPLQIYNFWPVTETERIYGILERYATDSATVKTRLIRYATQPDAAFNASGLTPLKREFGLDVTYEEGLLANEGPRKGALIGGFSERLASAVVALVEEP